MNAMLKNGLIWPLKALAFLVVMPFAFLLVAVILATEAVVEIADCVYAITDDIFRRPFSR